MLKLIIALVDIEITDRVIKVAREAGATGATIFHDVRGEGIKSKKTFLGLNFTSSRNAILFVAAESRAARILECIEELCDMDDTPGTGIAIQLAIEDGVGFATQLPEILDEMEEEK